jgi:MFS family permease
MEGRFSRIAQLVRAGLATGPLRELQVAWGASALGSWTFFIALAVYAYQAGGATAVGAAALARMVPAGLAAPVAGAIADRRSRRDVVLATFVLRAAVALAIAAAVAADAPLGVVLALAALFTIVAAAHKPAQTALLPTLAETPRQLGAANALVTGVDNGAFMAGSLTAGVLIATTSVAATFVATAALLAVAVVPMAAIHRDPVPEYRAGDGEAGALADAIAGFRELAAHPDVRLVVGFLSVTTLVEGAIDVLVVVLAIDLLDLGNAGVGWLNAAWGVGGVLGGGAALGLLHRGRLSGGIALGGILAGGALLVAASVLEPGVALAMLAAVGVGYALIETAGTSLLQRMTSDEVLGRAFAVVETSYWLTTGLGAMLAPAVIAVLGERGAIAAIGACLPLAVALRWSALRRFEEHAVVPEQEFGALRALPLFAPLPIATIENLARRVETRPVQAGETVIRRGDHGDDFYVVADGVLDVSDCDGAPPPLERGDFFGEIALLRDVPRTATITARDDGSLYVLDRDAFLSGVGAHRRSSEFAERAATERLSGVDDHRLRGTEP